MNDVGLARGTVRLESYNSSWPTIYELESYLIQQIIDLKPDDIQHVGSTSIPGMVAKPIIDIAIRVDSLDIAEKWKNKLESIGYWYKGIQASMPDRRFFAKGHEDSRTAYLHLVNQKEFDKLIKFRDFLITHRHAAMEYATLKQRLAAANENDRANYSRLKNDFIQKVINTGGVR